jgi:single-strand DNA-binding protein
MEITGTLHKVYQVEQVTEKFKKKEFVIKTDSNFNPYIIMQLGNDKCALLDGFKEGDRITASVNIGGREASNKKYYNTIEAWKIARA